MGRIARRVVQTAAVDNSANGVKQVELGGAFGPVGIGDFLTLVVKVCIAHSAIGPLDHVIPRVGLVVHWVIGVDSDESYPIGGCLRGDALDSRFRADDIGTMVASEGDDGSVIAQHITQTHRFPAYRWIGVRQFKLRC